MKNYKLNIASTSTLILLFASLTISIIYIGCKKESTIQNTRELDANEVIANFIAINNSEIDGEILFQHQDAVTERIFNNGINNPYSSFSAGFYKNRNKAELKLVGSLTVDNRSISPKGLGYSFTEFGKLSSDAKWLKSLWGKKINLTAKKPTTILNGSADDFSLINFSSQIYLPEPIEITEPNAGVLDYQLSKNGETVSWNPDPNNNTGKIVIMIMYDASANLYNNPSAQPNDEIIVLKEVPDNGSYTLSKNELIELTSKTRVLFAIARGSSVIIPDATDPTKKVSATAISSSLKPMEVE